MTDRTTKLQLPYILPSQAQKHVTHNEALQRLDAVVQLVIADVPATPPSSPEEGDCFLIAENATGDWSGNAGKLAFRQDGAWLIMQPKPGWTAWFAEAGRYRVLQDGSWQDMPLPATGRMDRLGIGTDADATNRFALASPASLFTHTNGDHRMTINKAGSADTASLLFQSGWSGRAEMGLAGNDGFSIKTSADGATWQTALLLSGSGHIDMPHRPLLRAELPAGNLSPANGSSSGFSVLAIQQGGFALGNDVGAAPGKEIVIPATGLYLAALSLAVVSSSGHQVSLAVNGAAGDLSLIGTTASAGTLQSGLFMVALNAGDRLSLRNNGSATFAQGPGKSMLLLAKL